MSSPVPDARSVRPETDVLLRLDGALAGDGVAATTIRVVGSRSGPHAGRTLVLDGGRALDFRPASPFALDETVDVTVAAAGAASGSPLLHYAFTTASRRPPDPTPEETLARVLDDPLATAMARRGLPTRGAAAAPPPVSLTFPHQATFTPDGSAQGKLFMAPFTIDNSIPPYLFVLDDQNGVIFSRGMTQPCLDFKLQPDGRLTYFDNAAAKFYALDGSTYAIVDSFACGNGFPTDPHELRILPDGHALLLGVDEQLMDMSQVVPGGNPNATVIGQVIQELDVDKNVVFQWRTLDHIPVTDATHENLTASTIDYDHANALEVDNDGNILLSSRHLDEITKIDRSTGDILWRFGGKNNQFTLVGDTLFFSHQHAIRRIQNGDVTLFDNGNFHSPPFSRAVEYQLDEVAKTATLVWQFRSTPDDYGLAMGYVERLDDGSTLVSYGFGTPDAMQVQADGTVSMVLNLFPGMISYRILRQAFDGPVVGVPPTPAGAIALSAPVPNPSRGQSTVFLTLAHPDRVGLQVFDVRGRMVQDVLDRAPRSAGTYALRLDLSASPSGIYFARVTTDRGSISRRIVKLD